MVLRTYVLTGFLMVRVITLQFVHYCMVSHLRVILKPKENTGINEIFPIEAYDIFHPTGNDATSNGGIRPLPNW